MKKFLVVLVALMFATGAFAQDAAKKGAEFKYSVFGVAYGVSGSQGDKEWDYQHIRVRPMFTASNENVSAVVRFEIDQDFGATADGTSGADKGTDNKVVEVKWAYLQVKDFFVPNLTFTTGLKDYFYPTVIDNDFGITAASYDFGMGSATLGYIKLIENDVVENTDADVAQNTDVQTYLADVTVKLGAITVRPAVFYLNTGKEASVTVDSIVFDEFTAYDYAVDVAGDFGMVNFEGAFSYLSASADVAGESVDVSGYAYDLGVNVKPVEGLTIGLFTSYNSGADYANDKVAYNMVLDTVLGAPDGRLFLLEANGTDASGVNQQIDETAASYGYSVYGVNAEYVMGKLAVFAQYGYMVSAEDNTAGDSAIGSEIDARVSYEVAPGTSFLVEVGYIMAGDDTFYADDTTQYLWGLQTKI